VGGVSATCFHTAVRDDGETEVEVEIDVHSWGAPAHYGSLSYPGHPAEPPEVEIIDAWLMSDAAFADAPRLKLTDAEVARIEIDFLENPPEPDYGDDY